MLRFPDNSRVCFIGDSLTHNNTYLSYIIDTYNKNFKNSNIRFFNCGTSGGTAEFALSVFEEDVMLCKPTHAVITLGVNDSGRWLLADERTVERYETLNERFETYKKSVELLCNRIANKGINLILCTPPPYDEYTEGGDVPFKGGFALMAEYANFIRNFASKNNIPLCDYHTALTKTLQTDRLYGDDRIHLLPHGYFVMSKYFLENQGISIGEEYPLPDYFSEWAGLIRIYRDIFAAECMIIDPNASTTEEKIQYAKEFIATRNDWFAELATAYISNKPHQKELFNKLSEVYENRIFNKGCN